jgi:hypothetical protein
MIYPKYLASLGVTGMRPPHQWQLAQLPPEQLAQPPAEDGAAAAPVRPPPLRVRQADMSFFVRPEAHLGHGGQVVAALDTISSNWAPQS